MEEMVDEPEDLKDLATKIARIKDSVREQLIAKLARIRKETIELREHLDLLVRVQEAENLNRPGGGQSESAGEVQETQRTGGEKIHNDLKAPKQVDRRRLRSCGLENRNCGAGVFTSEHSMSVDMIRHYRRQLLVPSLGVSGQGKLSNSSVLVVGMGGLGSPIA